MKCKCSLNNNYEIIGLCDIEKFNQKINQFTDKSWTQVIIPEKLVLPNSKPSIKSITKVYLDIKITSTKLIKTPSSDTPNIEGLALTGKLLLVSGQICQRIVYISETACNTVCSVKFNVSFSTYIVVDENTDLENDYFCIYPCVEDVSVRQLTERILTKSVTLFLFAHKTTQMPQPPVIEKLPNAFIFETIHIDEEMAKVEFDITNKKLIVSSTGRPYDNTGLKEAYKFELLASDGTTIKASESISGDENADSFRDALNDSNFEFGDLIKIDFINKLRLRLTDYPTLGRNYFMISEESQGFKITPTGIVPHILPNIIALDNSARKRVISIRFDILAKSILLAASTTNTTNNGTNNYFIATLYESNGRTPKKVASISGNSIATISALSFNDTKFEYGDVLDINSEEPNMISITNFPTSATSVYHPRLNQERFRITETGLKPYSNILPNRITLFNSNNSPLLYIDFDISSMTYDVTATSALANNLSSGSFLFRIFVNSKTAYIRPLQNANTAETELNNEPFLFNSSIIELDYDKTANNQVIINNFPKEGDIFNPPATQSSYGNIKFIITPTGIRETT